MMSVILGFLASVMGAIGVYCWKNEFFSVLKGLLPISFVCGGIIAIATGLSSLRKK